ncbi:MAG: hypothetical protein WBA74_01415, partial [Cyclobacteriaceae bacterium]
MMDYYIIGAGGFSREVLLLADETLDKSIHRFRGFIDRKPDTDVLYANGIAYPLLDEENFINNRQSDLKISLFIGVGNPGLISKIGKLYEGFNFPNLVHPSAIVNEQYVILGKGNIVTAGCCFTSDVHVGDYNIFNLNTTV